MRIWKFFLSRYVLSYFTRVIGPDVCLLQIESYYSVYECSVSLRMSLLQEMIPEAVLHEKKSYMDVDHILDVFAALGI
jgi:hypothetical protein